MQSGLTAAQLAAIYDHLAGGGARASQQAASAAEGGTALYDLEFERNNEGLILLPSAVRTASLNGQDRVNHSARGIILVVDITVRPGVETVTFTLQGKDQASSKYYTVLASAALGPVATTVLRVYPGFAVTANLSANDVLPRDWRLITTHSGAGSWTYSVGGILAR